VKKLSVHNFSISQSILAATLIIVMIVLLFTSVIYYATFSRSTESLIESQSREINKQIVLNYESYINSVIETANYVQFLSLNLDVRDSLEELQDIYLFNADIKKDVVSIFLFDGGGKKILGNDQNRSLTYSISDEPWFVNARKEPSIFHFSAPHKRGILSGSDELVISVSRTVEYTDGGEKKEGIILIELNFKAITDLADKTNLGLGGHILILDDDDSLIYTSVNPGTATRPGDSLSLAVEYYFGGFKATINSQEMYININTLAHTRWRIVTVNNVNDIAAAQNGMILFLFVIFLASFLLTTVVALMISRRISRPLNQLEKWMMKIENGEFDTKVTVSGQKEIVLVAKSFNNMIDEIRSLMDKLVSEQKEKRKSELVALQNQINPHFLYNTLDSIVWLAENQRSDDVITTVVALARFFRISISRGQTYIPVKDEISHIRNYLTIQKIRYVDKFEYEFEIDREIYEFKVMKLTLQPIVENAINYGIGDETGLITIRGYREDGFLIFEVENTGYGITEERIQEIYKILRGTHSRNSVGMRNVYLRLKLYYGDEADIVISSELDEMTNVKLMIPLKGLKEQERK